MAPLLSEDAQVYPVIADPPFAGATQLTVSARAAVVTVGGAGFAGTEVAVTIVAGLAELFKPFPLALVARIVKV